LHPVVKSKASNNMAVYLNVVKECCIYYFEDNMLYSDCCLVYRYSFSKATMQFS
jgi:hypothetical protein